MHPEPLSNLGEDQSKKETNRFLSLKALATKRNVVFLAVLLVAYSVMRTYQSIESERAYQASLVRYQSELAVHNQDHGWKKEFTKLYSDSLFSLVAVESDAGSGGTYDDVFKQCDILAADLRQLETSVRSFDPGGSSAGSQAKYTLLAAISSAIEIAASKKSYWRNQMLIKSGERVIKLNNSYSDQPFYGSIYRESKSLISDIKKYSGQSYDAFVNQKAAEERLKEKRVEIMKIIREHHLSPCKPVRRQSDEVVRALKDALSSTRRLEADAIMLTEILLDAGKDRSKISDLTAKSRTFGTQADGLLNRPLKFEGEARDQLLLFWRSLKEYVEVVAECVKANDRLGDMYMMLLYSEIGSAEYRQAAKKLEQQKVVFEESRLDVMDKYERFLQAKRSVELIGEDLVPTKQ